MNHFFKTIGCCFYCSFYCFKKFLGGCKCLLGGQKSFWGAPPAPLVAKSQSTSTSVQPNVQNEKCKARQPACIKTIKELYLKNKRPARGNIVLQRNLQNQKVQVARENHQRPRTVLLDPICQQ